MEFTGLGPNSVGSETASLLSGAREILYDVRSKTSRSLGNNQEDTVGFYVTGIYVVRSVQLRRRSVIGIRVEFRTRHASFLDHPGAEWGRHPEHKEH
jgi:hypothetical protein